MDTALIPVGLVVVPITGALLIAATSIGAPRRAHALTLLIGGINLAAAVGALIVCSDGGVIEYAYGGWRPPFGIAVRIDGIGALIAALISGVALAVFIYSPPILRIEVPRAKPSFLAMSLLLIAALQGMAVTADLFNLYVFLEIGSLAAYTLVAVGGGVAALASFRYLLIGTVGASFYLLGVAYLFALTGSLNGADIAQALVEVAPTAALVVAVVFLTIGLGLKMAIFPMHGWLPDAYTYAPSVSSALIAGLMTKISALALLRVLYGVIQPAHGTLLMPISDVIEILACAGIVVGSLMAVAQRDLKRLFAYSSVAHLGYIALGLGIGNRAAVTGAVFNMVAHGVAKATLFLIAGGMMYRLGSRSVESLAGLGRSMPLSAAALVIAAFSMIGLPPTAGFTAKWYLLMGCLDAGRTDLFAVVVASTLLSAWYFLRLFEVAFFTPEEHLEHDSVGGGRELPLSMMGPIAVGAAALIALGLTNQTIIARLIESSALVAGLAGTAAP